MSPELGELAVLAHNVQGSLVVYCGSLAAKYQCLLRVLVSTLLVSLVVLEVGRDILGYDCEHSLDSE